MTSRDGTCEWPVDFLPRGTSFVTMWRMAQPPLEPPTPRHELRFARARFREAYNMDDVDAFLLRAHDALESRDGSITASDVRDVRFRPVRWNEGYRMGPVDKELDRVAAAFERLEGPADA